MSISWSSADLADAAQFYARIRDRPDMTSSELPPHEDIGPSRY